MSNEIYSDCSNKRTFILCSFAYRNKNKKLIVMNLWEDDIYYYNKNVFILYIYRILHELLFDINFY